MRPKLKAGVARDVAYPFSAEMLDLIHRRTMPFLNVLGLQTKPIAHIVQEAYLQGLKDACDALDHRDEVALDQLEAAGK